MALALLLLAAPASAVESVESSRQFDPVLSLTGDCGEEPGVLDPVLDPGCPDLHPPAAFAKPTSVATDFYGNIYVGIFGKAATGSEGRVDIFDPQGVYITEVPVPAGTLAVQVDSKGTLYVAAKFEGGIDYYRYLPTEYDGPSGAIAYGSPIKFRHSGAFFVSMAINPDNDHLFVNLGAGGVVELTSAEDENKEASTIDVGVWPYGTGLAIDADRNRIYATEEDARVAIFTLSAPHERLGTIEESAIPEGTFLQYISLAVDEGTGHLFLLDTSANRIYEFDESGSYVSTLERSFQVVEAAQMGIDNGPFSPNGAGEPSTKGHYLYVPSHKAGTGHSFAFFEPSVGPPQVKDLSAANPTASEVELRGLIDANGAKTAYRFEYTTSADFEANGFTNATLVEGGSHPAANGFKGVAQAIGGLNSATEYRFRIVAINEIGSAEAEGSFATYPSPPIDRACSNQAFRIGMSVDLPDCRAYELVTPGDTNGRAPVGTSHLGYFTNRQVSPAGDRLPFRVEGGTLPGLGGTGSYLGDPYLSIRGNGGWTTAHTGPDGDEAAGVGPGGSSPDQGFSFWTAEGSGSKVIDDKFTMYERYPDGHSELVGVGSIAEEPEVIGLLISAAGQHTLFATSATGSVTQLEPEAAPSGTQAIYDRAPDGDLRVISIKPGNVPFGPGDEATYRAASLDGKGVAFEVGHTLYLRYDNTETYEIGDDVIFAGVAEGGNRIFYVQEGKLLRFDAVTQEVTPFSTGAVTPVNVSPDGSAAYFVSTQALTTGGNPNGEKAKAGQQNLYLSREGDLSFVGRITERDVVGTSGATEMVDGLGLWTAAFDYKLGVTGRLALDPSRSTPDGSVLIFQSRAPLTGFDADGHPQVFRYDSVNGELQCLSCNPAAEVATGDATLQSYQRGSFALFYPTAWIENLRSDGRRVFFQSTEALVPGDTDGLQDIYEWEDQGVGSCNLPEGCVYLISSGHSIRDDYLWAVSASGDDVFILTSDLLLPADADATVSIYDARVGGGFPPSPSPSDCQGEGCRPQLSPGPALTSPNTPVTGTDDNVKPVRHCRKGHRKVKRHGKVRCVKKHHRKAGTKRKGARK